MTESQPTETAPAPGALRKLKGNTYLVTEDLSKLVTRWCKKRHEPFPDIRFFESIMTSLCDALQRHCFPDEKIKVVHLPQESFADILDRRRSRDAERLNEFWVALDDVYADIGVQGEDGFHISITRFVDKDDVNLKRGARPESPFTSIDEQIKDCAKCWAGSSGREKRPVVLVDDGTFTGGTIIKVLKQLANHGMLVNTIRLGVANPDAINAIAEWKHEETQHSVGFLGCLKLCPPVFDWVAERDFFPGVPFSGRAVGRMEDGIVSPIRASHSNGPFRKSYLSGWGQIQSWAQLTTGKDAFTRAALELSIQLWEELEKRWGRPILVSDLDAIPWLFYRSDSEKMHSVLGRRWLEILRTQLESVPN